MVHRGAFHGSRKDFLLGEKPTYAAGVDGGYAADALAIIQRRYFKRYPVTLDHEEEPTAEHLAAVDDNAPEAEEVPPDVDVLGEEDFAKAVKEMEKLRDLVTFRKGIKHWLVYQYMKDHDLDPKDSGLDNPYRILLHQLTGVKSPRPRLKTPANVWRKTQRDIIDQEVARRMDMFSSTSVRRRDLVSTRDKVVREMFSQLPEADKNKWAEQAREEHKAALEVWEAEQKRQPSTEPAERQKCINGLTRFVQPILNSIVEATGWKVSLIAGGPEPADGGRLNIISIHSGTTTGVVPMNFGCAERLRYKKYIVPAFGTFLQKCFTVEECRSYALPTTSSCPSLATLDLNQDEVNYDAVSDITASGTNTVPPSDALLLVPRPPGPIHVSGPPSPPRQPSPVVQPSPLYSPSQINPPRQGSVPVFSPVLPSRPLSPRLSNATSHHLSTSSARAPSVSASEGTTSTHSSSDSSSSRLPHSPPTTLSSHSATSNSPSLNAAPVSSTNLPSSHAATSHRLSPRLSGDVSAGSSSSDTNEALISVSSGLNGLMTGGYNSNH